MNRSVVPGSLSAVAEQNGTSLADAFMNCEIMAVVDISGSMNAQDSRGGKSRWLVASEELAKLQAAHPGKAGLMAFSDRTEFVPGGLLPPVGLLGGGTDLAGALKFAKVVDGAVRLVVVSDGQPDSESESLQAAAELVSEISCIYTGPEEAYSGGADFLRRLAKRKGGSFATAASADLLGDKIEQVLLKAG